MGVTERVTRVVPPSFVSYGLFLFLNVATLNDTWKRIGYGTGYLSLIVHSLGAVISTAGDPIEENKEDHK